MDAPITFTPHEFFSIILAICGAIITISGAVVVIMKAVDRVKAPDKKQDERIGELEEAVKKINARLDEGDRRFDDDAARFDELEQTMKHTNAIIIRSLQSLISHSINGNSIDALKHSKEELDEYLLNK